MANKVTTEWEDIHVKLGNYLPREKEETNDEIEKAAIEAVENYDPLARKTVEQLKELEDDEDDEVIRQYTEKRMQELRELAMKPKFGQVYELRKQDYIAEVTNAPQGVFVVLHLYQTYIEASNILSEIFDYLAKKFVLVKFMKIVATNCIEEYKDIDVPGVIIYQNAQVFKQFIPAVYYFGGKSNLSWKKVEWIFSSLGIVKTDLEDDPFDVEEPVVSSKKKKLKRDDESDEEDRDDKEYYWKIKK